MASHTTLWTLVGMSLLPPLVYLLWVRSLEDSNREPMGRVLWSFLYGGTVGAILAVVLNTLFGAGPVFFAESSTGLSAVFLTVVIAAPIIEEFTKGLGLGRRRGDIKEWEDGIIYGTAIGLGFAATENLGYGLAALSQDGSDVAILTIVMRTFSSMLLHAATTAMIGFGYARIVLRGGVIAMLLPYYLIAVALHAAFNYLVLSNTLLGLVTAVVLVFFVTGSLRGTIRRLDALPHSKHS